MKRIKQKLTKKPTTKKTPTEQRPKEKKYFPLDDMQPVGYKKPDVITASPPTPVVAKQEVQTVSPKTEELPSKAAKVDPPTITSTETPKPTVPPAVPEELKKNPVPVKKNPYDSGTFLGIKLDSMVVRDKEKPSSVLENIENIVLDYLTPEDVTTIVTYKPASNAAMFKLQIPLKERLKLREKTRFENLFTTCQTLCPDQSIVDLKTKLDAEPSDDYKQKYTVLWKEVEPRFKAFLKSDSIEHRSNNYFFYDCILHYCANNKVGAAELLEDAVCYPEKETLIQFLISEKVNLRKQTLLNAVIFKLPLEIIKRICELKPNYEEHFQIFPNEPASKLYAVSFALFHPDPAVLDFLIQKYSANLASVFAGLEKMVQNNTNVTTTTQDKKSIKSGPFVDMPRKLFIALMKAAKEGYLFDQEVLRIAIIPRFNPQFAQPYNANCLERNIVHSINKDGYWTISNLLSEILIDPNKQEIAKLFINNNARIPEWGLVIALSYEASFEVIEALNLQKTWGNYNGDRVCPYSSNEVLYAVHHPDPKVLTYILEQHKEDFEQAFDILRREQGKTVAVVNAPINKVKNIVLASPLKLLLGAEQVLKKWQLPKSTIDLVNSWMLNEMQSKTAPMEMLQFFDLHADKDYFNFIPDFAAKLITGLRDKLKDYFSDSVNLEKYYPDKLEEYHTLFLKVMSHSVFNADLEKKYKVAPAARDFLAKSLEEINDMNPVLSRSMRAR